jgi:hypothetical protein
VLSNTDQVRRRLVYPTLEYVVANSVYYKEKLGNLLEEVNSLSDIRKLPILYKETFIREQEKIICKKETPNYIKYTLATSDEQISVPVCQSEIDAYRDLILSQLEFTKSLPLTLSIMSNTHCNRDITLARSPTVSIPVDYDIKDVIKLLQKEYNYPGIDRKITVIHGSWVTLRNLTIALLNQGYDPSMFGIKILDLTWKASIVDRYCMIETHSGAQYCAYCNWYHFDFTVIPEIVSPMTLSPVKEGTGVLLLTGLYPFNQAQPMIRYWTGDFFEIKATACKINEPSYMFKGHIEQTVYWIEDEKIHYLLFPVDVAEILDEFPDVVRKEDTGALKFRAKANLQTRPLQITLFVQLCYQPELYTSRVAEIEGRLLEGLSRSNSTFRRFLEKKIIAFKVQFLGPTKSMSSFEV